VRKPGRKRQLKLYAVGVQSGHLREPHGPNSRITFFAAACKLPMSIKKWFEAYRFNRARAIVQRHTVADWHGEKVAPPLLRGLAVRRMRFALQIRGRGGVRMGTRSGGPTGRGAVALFLYYDIAVTPRLAVSGRPRLAASDSQRPERRGNGLYSSFL
jgi:hypothetical protein